jgi:putative nucleotidyltransferase with HDIG domain
MRFATRAFLWSFLPFAALLGGSFWAVRTAALSAVREALRTSVRDNQVTLVRERGQNESRNTRILRVAAENPALKAGLELLATERSARDAARRTVEDQLSEICDTMGFDFLAVSGPSGEPLAGVVRGKEGFSPMDLKPDLKPLSLPAKGFFSTQGHIFQVTSVAISQGQEHVGTLAVGERFDLAGVAMPAVLLQGGNVVASTTPSANKSEVEAALRKCSPGAECELRIGGETYMSVPLDNAPAGGPDDGFALRSLSSLDAAAAPVQVVLRRVFLSAGLTALVVAIALGAFSSRSIVQPLAAVVARLRESGKTGVLPEFPTGERGVREIRELTDSFNHAAASIREGQDQLIRAYVEFVSSLASALDARDPYTAGHSLRVSEYSCAIAQAMNVEQQEHELIRVGALLHDIGKIGISDAVLQKQERLTPEEEALIREHPVIGKKILECVHGFEAYLPVVELHHENWDGTGYPRGLKGEETPRTARIVKVADAYDAMTSDRPYRRGMRHEQAIAILEKHAGTQFDVPVVQAFVPLGDIIQRPADSEVPVRDSLHHLAAAMRSGFMSPVSPAAPTPAAVEETPA